MIGVGVIGTGRMGTGHSGLIAELQNAKLVAAYDIDTKQIKKYQEKFPGIEAVDSAEALVNHPGVDLIVITTPTYCHCACLKTAMKTGKAIFCEKPLCRTKEELAELSPLVTEYPNFFAVGFVRRYYGSTRKMFEILEEKRLGKLLCATANSVSGSFKREWGDWFADFDKSGGVTLDMIIHHVDLLNAINGAPASVYAKALMLNKENENPSDFLSGTITYKNGVICNLECSWLRSGPYRSFMVVYGEKGTINVSDTDGILFYEPDREPQKIEFENDLNQMQVIIDCIETHQAPLAGRKEAIEATRICLAMLESAQTGKAVTL